MTQVVYGDTEVVRRRAGQLRDQAADVRMLADQLVAQTDALGWTGRAASSMRERVQERATHLRHAATDHELAADSLDKHAADAAVVQDQIAEVERRATTLVADAATRVARIEEANARDGDPVAGTGVQRTVDPDDAALVAFTPPPSGHRDWLDVELPGL